MSRGVNKVILVGNVGNQPEIKQTSGGLTIATVSLATTDSRKDKDGNRQEKTEWHRVKFFGKTAEIVQEYVQKGTQLYVEGKIEYGSYEKDGVKHYTTDIIGNDMQMIGSKPGGNGGQSQQQSRPAPQRPAPARQPAPAPAYDDFADDDIPF